MNRRLIGLLLALVLAGVATFFLIQYVRSADERAREEEELAQVFRAQGDIPAGMTAEDAMNQALVDTDEVPRRLVPPGAVASLDQISGQVATFPIGDGEIIVTQRFGSTVAAETGGQAFEIPEGLQAVAVVAEVVPGLAGFVQPGDTVSMLASFEQAPAEETDEDEDLAAPASGARTQYVVQNVVVLAVGQRVVTTQEDGQTAFSTQLSNDQYIFTLGMEPADIERAVFTTQQGNLWFTLVPEDQEPATTPGRTLDNVLD